MAPKKSNRSGAGPKKNTPNTSTSDDTSFIVFSNAKTEPKSASKGKAAANKEEHPTEEPKKPDVRTLIGGASWTGKLPVTLLSEHCQKQKWANPEYTMHKTPSGFSSGVILKSIDPKTKETTVLPPFKLPQTHVHLAQKPTALEARHFAAAYALFRVCSMKNLHMMLPPTYRDLWKGEFSDLKKEDIKAGREWMYGSDPFAAKQEQEEVQAAKKKKRDEEIKSKELKKEQVELKIPGIGNSKGDRGWNRAPKIELGRKVRLEIEKLVKMKAVWNPFQVRIPDRELKAIVEDLSHAGFRRSHVEEAAAQCKDREEVLEWLLVHVPEDDLPQWALPEGYTAGLSLASSDLVKEAKLRRLAEAGYSTYDCQNALDDSQGNERRAAEILQNTLLNFQQETTFDLGNLNVNENTDVWLEEVTALEAIYGDKYTSSDSESCQIKADHTNGREPVTFYFSKSQRYPMSVPILSVSSKGLPAYIRLSITRQVLQYAQKHLLNEPMIFNIFDWLEANIQHIIESPGKLRDVALLPPMSELTDINSQRTTTSRSRKLKSLDTRPGNAESTRLKSSLDKRQEMPAYKAMLASRQTLPAWAVRETIVETVRNHAVTIISGDTGSGKSTQSMQFILDDMIARNQGSAVNIICTQPRRISALGLADRISEERCVSVGQEVGYSIRGESKNTPGVTKIALVTTGVLLRRLQTSVGGPHNISAALRDVSHVVVDEVHERTLDGDLLLALLKETLNHRRDLKVVLMSATLDSTTFVNYFGGDSRVGRVEIQGRTFPIDDYYLDNVLQLTNFDVRSKNQRDLDAPEDVVDRQESEMRIGKLVQNLGMGINYDLISSLVVHIQAQLRDKPGAVLVFLPGVLEIDRCLRALRLIRNVYALPLHASLQPAEQRRVFGNAPKGQLKVICSTNVAETSITIDDIVAVIDTGRVKETSYDPIDKMVKLEEVWASLAACKQRRGRAGRVAAGSCYKLFTKVAEGKMAPHPEPEIRRVPLEQLCLSVTAMGIHDVESFLRHTLTPPEDLAVSGAMRLLCRMGAIQDQRLTALGSHLATIPADLRCAKLMVFGAIFGCLESCLTIAAILTVKSPFVSPMDKRDEAKAARMRFSLGDGDLLTDLNAYNEWAEKRQDGQLSAGQLRSWCTENFLSAQTLQIIRDNRAQYLSSLKETGFILNSYPAGKSTSLNSQNNSAPLLRALIAGSFSPRIPRISLPEKKYASAMSGAVEMDPEARTIKYFSQDNGRVFVHPSSVIFSAQSFTGNAEFLSFYKLMATQKVFLRELTPFNAYTLLLFCGPITLDTKGILVDGWQLKGWARIGVLVSRLRLMLDSVLAEKIDNPGVDLESSESSEVLSLVRKIIEKNGLDQ